MLNRTGRKPTWKTGFARSAGESAYPQLWNGLNGAWVPNLGPTGLDLFDVSGIKNDGTLTNMEIDTDWNVDEIGYNLNFGGTNEIVTLEKPIQWGSDPDELTISAWVKLDDTLARRMTILGHDNQASAISFEVDADTGPNANIAAIIPGVFIARSDDFDWPNVLEWVNILYTRRGSGSGNSFIYFKGEQLTLQNDAANSFVQPTTTTKIGRRASGSQQLIGGLAEVLTWDRAFSSSEAKQIETLGPSGIFTRRRRTFFLPAQITAAITGTATASIDEDDITTGGKTIIITLTGDTWVAAGPTFNAERQAIIDGLDSAQVEATGWNAEVRDKEIVGSIARTSDTVVTITLSAAAAYDITAQETITVTVPASALVTSASPIIATPTFTVDQVVVALGGKAQLIFITGEP